MLKQFIIPLLILILFPCIILANTVTVTQGETVTLNIKITNNSEKTIIGLKVCIEDSPQWIVPLDNSMKADLTGKKGIVKPHAMLPFTFTVSENVPLEAVCAATLKLVDDNGRLWTKSIQLKVTPNKPLLRQNYPNPFNPETWIPYQLSEDSRVTISIFDSSGRIVRTLDLGHKGAGFYIAKSDAAYWDGRNDSGELVSSGVYFYHLQAEKFSDIKKMLILR